jgi:hypothetical protein
MGATSALSDTLETLVDEAEEVVRLNTRQCNSR